VEYASCKSGVQAPKSEQNPKNESSREVFYYVLGLLWFAFALMSKAMAVTVPFVLLLLDYWPLRRFRAGAIPKLLREKVPFFLLSAISCFVTIEVQRAGGATRFSSELPITARLANALVSYVWYLGKTFWPADLMVFHPHPLHRAIWPIASAMLILAAITVVVLFVPNRRYFAVGWFWFVGTLIPVIGLVQVGDQAMADRYMYIPSIGLFIAIVWGFAEFVRGNLLLERTANVMAVAAIVVLSVVTQNLAQSWQNSETLFQRALAVDKNNAAAHNFLGSALASQGRLTEAEEHFVQALRIRPDFPYAEINYAAALGRQGKVEEGISRLLRLLKKHPSDEEARCGLGLLLLQKGDVSAAIEQYQQALLLKPEDADAMNNLAWIRAANPKASFRNGEEAVGFAQRACELTRFRKPVMIGTLAAALAEAGRFPEAIAAGEKAQAVAKELGQLEVADRNGKLLQLYRAGNAYHGVE